jgi:beta-glucosidase
MHQERLVKVRRGLAIAGAFVPAVFAAAVACSHPDSGAAGGTAAASGDGTMPTSGSSGGTGSAGGSGSNTTGSAGGTSGNGAGSGSAVSGAAATGDNGNSGSGAAGSASTFDGGPSQMLTDGEAPDVAKIACANVAYSDAWTPGYTPDPTVLAKVQTTLASMTLTQQANQMRGTNSGAGAGGNFTDNFRSPDDTMAQIAGFTFRDGPRGVCLNAELPAGKSGYSTAFPVPSGRGATFDLALEEQIGEAIGDEMLASRTQFGKANTMLLAPVINILRHPAWGRAEETYGEDSFLLGRFGSAFTTGAQKYVAACAKHYAANNIENGRASENAIVDERTLREMYTRHFGAVIQDAGVACVMASYNLVNGQHATGNSHLLTDILRTDMGFQGFTMSDWWAIPGGNMTLPASTLQANAISSIGAQLDMEMPWSYAYSEIESLVPAQLTNKQIATAAGRVLQQKFRFKATALTGTVGLQTPVTTFDSTNSIANNAAHITLARQAALESMVLLKNANSTLPIIRTKVKTVAVIGAQVPFTVSTFNGGKQATIDFPNNVRLGDMGSSRVFSDPAKSTTPFQGIQAVAGTGITVVSGNTATAAANADFVVVVAGLTPQDEGEEYTGAADRSNFELDDKNNTTTQDTLITAVAALNKPMVVVLEGGSVISMPWLAQVPAVVMAWYPGMDGGTALGKLLFGDVNFSGKLPVTWPKQWADEPAFPGSTLTADYHVGYSWFDNNKIQPLFAFGSGLSYTTFKYDYMNVPCSTVSKGGVVSVAVGITNTGTVAGDEVAFLFVSYPTGITRPAKELKGFYRATAVAPGQTAQITIPLRISDLKYWDTTSNSWQIQTGTYNIMVGPSSDNLTLMDTVTVQ